MFKWIAENWGTVLAGFIVLSLLASVVVKMIRDKKKGKRSCGCNCVHCPKAGGCEPDADADQDGRIGFHSE
ncbi:hypothetical protein FACS1894211_14750 [Clostridia bacterium]|nr:hypothetical protein FACS1894211_14750 [Clostridia bacterium]